VPDLTASDNNDSAGVEEAKKQRQQISDVCHVSSSVPRVEAILHKSFEIVSEERKERLASTISGLEKMLAAGLTEETAKQGLTADTIPIVEAKLVSLKELQKQRKAEQIRISGTAAPAMAALLDWSVEHLIDATLHNMELKKHATVNIADLFSPDARPEGGIQPEQCAAWPFIATTDVINYDFCNKAGNETRKFTNYARKIYSNYRKRKELPSYRLSARFCDFAAQAMECIVVHFAELLKAQLCHGSSRTVTPDHIMLVARMLQIHHNRPASDAESLCARITATVELKQNHTTSEKAKRKQREEAKILKMTPEERAAYDKKQIADKQARLQKTLEQSHKRAQEYANKMSTTKAALAAITTA